MSIHICPHCCEFVENFISLNKGDFVKYNRNTKKDLTENKFYEVINISSDTIIYTYNDLDEYNGYPAIFFRKADSKEILEKINRN